MTTTHDHSNHDNNEGGLSIHINADDKVKLPHTECTYDGGLDMADVPAVTVASSYATRLSAKHPHKVLQVGHTFDFSGVTLTEVYELATSALIVRQQRIERELGSDSAILSAGVLHMVRDILTPAKRTVDPVKAIARKMAGGDLTEEQRLELLALLTPKAS